MKKSPWKFLVGLASRRREAGAEEASSAPKSDSDSTPVKETVSDEASGGSPGPSAAHRNDQRVPAVADALDRAVDVDAGPAGEGGAPSTDAQELVPALGSHSEPGKPAGVEEDAPVESGAVSAPARRTRGPGRPKIVDDRKSAAGGDSSRAAAEPAVLADSPFIVQIAKLDEEVQQLRLHLADKLRMQNEQLRKMLERYDRLS